MARVRYKDDGGMKPFSRLVLRWLLPSLVVAPHTSIQPQATGEDMKLEALHLPRLTHIKNQAFTIKYKEHLIHIKSTVEITAMDSNEVIPFQFFIINLDSLPSLL